MWKIKILYKYLTHIEDADGDGSASSSLFELIRCMTAS